MDYELILRWIIGLLMIAVVCFCVNYILRNNLKIRPRIYLLATIIYFGIASVHILNYRFEKRQQIINEINKGVDKNNSKHNNFTRVLGDTLQETSFKYVILLGFGGIPLIGLLYTIVFRNEPNIRNGHLEGIVISIFAAIIIITLFSRL